MASRRQAISKKQKAISKKQPSRLGFPQIFRKIPARVPFLASIHLWRWLFILVALAILVLQLVQLGQILYSNYNEAQIKQAQKATLESEVAKWRRVIAGRPDYRDGYFELAVLMYRLDRGEEAKRYLNKVFELDPNFEPAKKLENAIK